MMSLHTILSVENCVSAECLIREISGYSVFARLIFETSSDIRTNLVLSESMDDSTTRRIVVFLNFHFSEF